MWTLEKSSRTPHVESLIAKSLSARQSEEAQEACEAFGVLWRLTGVFLLPINEPGLTLPEDDAILPGFRLKVPMMITLDLLKSDDPHLRRVAETWMRCSLKSYLR